MTLARSVRMGAWLLIGLNLLMGLGCIWIFTRMAPAIEVIIDRNERSLQASEEMLASLAMITHEASRNDALKATFTQALQRAQNNITEAREPAALKDIESRSAEAFEGNMEARQHTVSAIILLGKINSEAMITADGKARQLGYAGAWGVVFMALSVFLAGILFIRSLSRSLVWPLEEIHRVIIAHRSGDTLRRCTVADLPKDAQRVLNDLNGLLDSPGMRRQPPQHPSA